MIDDERDAMFLNCAKSHVSKDEWREMRMLAKAKGMTLTKAVQEAVRREIEALREDGAHAEA